MLGKSADPNQQNFLHSNLLDQLNPKAPLLQLAAHIPWSYFEESFSDLYSTTGRPSKPVRLMVGLCILKHVENLSDEAVVQRWVQNPYYQAFCGEVEFQWQFPCNPTDLVHFRKRIGKEGFEKIFAVSIAIHGEEIPDKEACIDTTVQEKNVTFPTDDKLHRKIIEHCWKLTETYDIKLRRSYRRELKKRLLDLRFRNHPKNAKKARKASKRLCTIAGILVRELRRKLPEEALLVEAEQFELYKRVLKQKRQDKNKVYSLHEPHIYCMSKGKPHKKYEFGVKVSIAKTKDSNLIVGAMAFSTNRFDGHTLPDALEQVKKLSKWIPHIALCDRGYRGKKKVDQIEIMIPESDPKKSQSAYQRAKQRKRFRKRAGIEGIIGHLKADHRLGRNFLSGFLGDEINVLMAAAAFNFRKWLREFYFVLYLLLHLLKAHRWRKSGLKMFQLSNIHCMAAQTT
jgi:IS5 family transposase